MPAEIGVVGARPMIISAQKLIARAGGGARTADPASAEPGAADRAASIGCPRLSNVFDRTVHLAAHHTLCCARRPASSPRSFRLCRLIADLMSAGRHALRKLRPVIEAAGFAYVFSAKPTAAYAACGAPLLPLPVV